MGSRVRMLPVQLGLLAVLGACQPAEEKREPAGRPAATASATPSSPVPELSCLEPVKPDDTADSLRRRYPGQTRVETLAGAEGEEFEGLVLWPDDPTKRIELTFADDAMQKVSAVALYDRSAWRVAGIALGDSLAKVRETNGAAFKLWGFDWDYGGYVSDLNGGKLASLPGGCRLVLRFEPQGEEALPEGLSGETELSSDDPRFKGVDARLTELSLALPSPYPEK